MKIALIQLDSRDDKARNIKKAFALSQQAVSRGAKCVVLPEYFTFRGIVENAQQLRAIAEPLKGPTTQMFAQLARKFRAHFVLGTMYERSSDPHKAYNTAVVLSSDGNIAGAYRKLHLFHMRLSGQDICEGRLFKAGRRLTVLRLGDFHMGLAVCFDLRFPDIFERSAKKGANLFAVPASFSYVTGQAHWEVLLRARAAETFSYVLAANQTGRNEQGVRCWGHSMAIDPWGKVLVQASGDREEIVYADIEMAEVRKYRERFPGYKKIVK